MAAKHGNLEMEKNCVANKRLMGTRYPITYAKNSKMGWCVHKLQETGHLEVLKYLRSQKAKRLGIGKLPLDGSKWSSSHTRISCRA